MCVKVPVVEAARSRIRSPAATLEGVRPSPKVAVASVPALSGLRIAASFAGLSSSSRTLNVTRCPGLGSDGETRTS